MKNLNKKVTSSKKLSDNQKAVVGIAASIAVIAMCRGAFELGKDVRKAISNKMDEFVGSKLKEQQDKMDKRMAGMSDKHQSDLASIRSLMEQLVKQEHSAKKPVEESTKWVPLNQR